MFDRRLMRRRRHFRVRNKIVGTTERPRMNVYRSLKNIYVQIIDDSKGETLAAASSLEEAIRQEMNNTGNKDAAKLVGNLIAERALSQGIKKVVFDRGGNLYHGRIKVLADAAREKGLQF